MLLALDDSDKSDIHHVFISLLIITETSGLFAQWVSKWDEPSPPLFFSMEVDPS